MKTKEKPRFNIMGGLTIYGLESAERSGKCGGCKRPLFLFWKDGVVHLMTVWWKQYEFEVECTQCGRKTGREEIKDFVALSLNVECVDVKFQERAKLLSSL